ncbi:unnamed protein product [Porites lobata]|uniref:Uncharacterized protein n=1 Tax=Porites lobata TaxID=104759 RepID=A0ABN8RLT9_9CNID|nr:unnamed protein product [Porites lobata]
METQTKFQNLPELKHLPVNEDKKGNLKPGDARSFGESRDPQEQDEEGIEYEQPFSQSHELNQKQEMGSQTELQDSLPELERISLHEVITADFRSLPLQTVIK